jgi:hypothetical protein
MVMTNPEHPEKTTGGLAGRAVGRWLRRSPAR